MYISCYFISELVTVWQDHTYLFEINWFYNTCCWRILTVPIIVNYNVLGSVSTKWKILEHFINFTEQKTKPKTLFIYLLL